MATLTALNGRLPDSLLTNLPWPEVAGFRLRADAAASAGRLAAAFYAHFAAPLLLTDAYRTLATQVALRASKGVWAATPGTSNHGLGIAIDFASGINVDGSVQHLWMVANAGRFGWVNPAWAINWNPADGQHEPWHWEFDPARDQHAHITPTPAPVIHTPAPLTPLNPSQEDDMLPTIIWCYTALMGRPATPEEVVFQLSVTRGWIPDVFVEMFLDQGAEPSAHVKAYRDFLGRDPVQADIDLRHGMTIRQVRAALSSAAATGAH